MALWCSIMGGSGAEIPGWSGDVCVYYFRVRKPHPYPGSEPIDPLYEWGFTSVSEAYRNIVGSDIDWIYPGYPWHTVLQTRSFVARNAVLDTLPLGSADVDSAEGTVTFTGLRKFKRTLTWDGISTFPVESVEGESSFDAYLSLFALKPEDGEWTPQTIATGGVPTTITAEDCTVKMDATNFVKAYLDHRNRRAKSFGLMVLPNDYAIPEITDDMASAMLALQEASTTSNLTFVWSDTYDMWLLSGTESASKIYWDTMTLDNLAVKFLNGSMINVNNLIAYEDVPANI